MGQLKWGSLQAVAFPGDALTVFPAQVEHESPSMKYPALQTERIEQSVILSIVTK